MAKKRKPAPFATRLRALRLRAGLSVPELAARAGLTKQSLSLLERGERQPTFATACKLADALGISVEDFR